MLASSEEEYSSLLLVGNNQGDSSSSAEDATRQTRTAVFWSPKQGVYFSYKYRCDVLWHQCV